MLAMHRNTKGTMTIKPPTPRHTPDGIWGHTPEGIPIRHWFLTNTSGARVGITNRGATVTSIRVPDRIGRPGEVLLGHDAPQPYLEDTLYLVCLVGRCANPIRNACCPLESRSLRLSINQPPHHLHGGLTGLSRKLWKEDPSAPATPERLTLTCSSPDGEDGYPGNLMVRATYTWTDACTLSLSLEAEADAPTLFNPTTHLYFNLRDGGASTIQDHLLQIHADAFLPTDPDLIPLGPRIPVAGTPLDFTAPKAPRRALETSHPQIRQARGVDHCFVLRPPGSGTLREAARLYDPASGRLLVLETTEPGLQCYTGNYLDGRSGRGSAEWHPHHALCLEPQHFPDSPNHPDYPSILLPAGHTFRSTTRFRFVTDQTETPRSPFGGNTVSCPT